MPIYLLIVGWMYVVLMMSVAEATSSTGTVLGAIVTFVLYGLAPVSLAVYLMSTPARRRAMKAREAAERAASSAPHGSGETPADAVTPVRKVD